MHIMHSRVYAGGPEKDSALVSLAGVGPYKGHTLVSCFARQRSRLFSLATVLCQAKLLYGGSTVPSKVQSLLHSQIISIDCVFTLMFAIKYSLILLTLRNNPLPSQGLL